MLDKKSEERLIAYLMDDLSHEERLRIQQELKADPQLADELTRLRECLQASEPEPEVAPEQLTNRTCWLVQCAINQANSLRGKRNVALGESQDPMAARSRWSLADMTVGAAILVVLAGLVTPALRDSRDATRSIHCQNNLMELGQALKEYSLRYNELPVIREGDNAGMFTMILAENGIRTPEELAQWTICPDSELADKVYAGCAEVRVPTRKELAEAILAHQERMRRYMGGSYAFPLGWVDQKGRLYQYRYTSNGNTPMLADAPCKNVPGFQSANHGTCGQYVLFQDRSVRFVRLCSVLMQLDHWFLNDEGRHQAGLHAGDMVLGRSEAQPLVALGE